MEFNSGFKGLKWTTKNVTNVCL